MFMMVIVLMSMAVPVMVIMLVIVPAATIVMVMMAVMVAVRMAVPHQTALKPGRPAAGPSGQGGGHRKSLFDPAEMSAHGVNLQKIHASAILAQKPPVPARII